MSMCNCNQGRLKCTCKAEPVYYGALDPQQRLDVARGVATDSARLPVVAWAFRAEKGANGEHGKYARICESEEELGLAILHYEDIGCSVFYEQLFRLTDAQALIAELRTRNEWLEQVAIEAAETERHALGVAESLRAKLAGLTEAARGKEIDYYRLQSECQSLQAQLQSTPAERGVVLPERHELRADSDIEDAYQRGWNGYADEYARLNQAPATAEQHPDDAAVDRFAVAMKSKLAKSREKGRHGWQNATAAHLASLLYEHMYKGDPLDVANLAMMLHQNGQGIELPHDARREPATADSDAREVKT